MKWFELTPTGQMRVTVRRSTGDLLMRKHGSHLRGITLVGLAVSLYHPQFSADPCFLLDILVGFYETCKSSYSNAIC